MANLTRNSPAKINLTLRVGHIRPDGFHEIESLIARVALHDTVSVTPRDDDQLTLTCNDAAIPLDESNLALRAARLLAETTRTHSRGVHITLRKQIPAGTGLGGGSSNAATTLMLLNELWDTRLPPAELARIGSEIGSDVPLFFHTPFCIARGRGEIVEPVPLRLAGWATLVLPEIHCATAAIYHAFDNTPPGPPRPAVEDLLQQPTTAEQLMPRLFNDLESAACSVNPQLAELSRRLDKLAETPVRMTGSGSAFFRLFDRRIDAEVYARRVRDELDLHVEIAPLETR